MKPTPRLPIEPLTPYEWHGYPDCPHCQGRGWVIGGDELRRCSRCLLRRRAEERHG